MFIHHTYLFGLLGVVGEDLRPDNDHLKAVRTKHLERHSASCPILANGRSGNLTSCSATVLSCHLLVKKQGTIDLP
jgi:hypothetical protein